MRPILTLSPAIDSAMEEFFARLRRLSHEDATAVNAVIVCGARHCTVSEIGEALLRIDPVVAGLFAQWAETVETEAWTAVVRLVFIGRRELLQDAAVTETEKKEAA